MPRSDFDVITGPPASVRPIPPASLPAMPSPAPATPRLPSEDPRSEPPELPVSR